MLKLSWVLLQALQLQARASLKPATYHCICRTLQYGHLVELCDIEIVEHS